MLAIDANNLMRVFSTEIVAVNSSGLKVEEAELFGMLSVLAISGQFALRSGCPEGR